MCGRRRTTVCETTRASRRCSRRSRRRTRVTADRTGYSQLKRFFFLSSSIHQSLESGIPAERCQKPVFPRQEPVIRESPSDRLLHPIERTVSVTNDGKAVGEEHRIVLVRLRGLLQGRLGE